MSDSSAKDIRKQVRNIAKEVLNQEFGQVLYDKVMGEVAKKLKEIENMVKDQLHEINHRHKDTMQYLVRQVTVPAKSEEDKESK